PFKTLCFFNYALMIRQDYDITSSLRRGALLEQSKSVHDTYPIEQDAQNVIIDSLDMNYDREEIDQNDDDNDLAKERELLASLIERLKCEIDESKNRNKFLETSNKVLIEKLKGEIEDFKTKNKSLESSNNFFKEANNKLSETNNLLYTDYKKSEAELARRNNKPFAHQETISILSKQKEAQIKLYKTREDKELDKVIELENKVKDLKAQLQDKDIVISELKKLIEKLKGKSVDTKFEKSSVIRQPNAFKRVIPTTSVSRLQLKSNPQGDRVMHNNSQGKKQPVEDHHRNVKLSMNKMSVTAFASESNKNPRNFTRKLYERVSKTCSWWYPKFTPLGYKWKPKSGKQNVNPNLVEIVLFIIDSGCSKHMTGNLKLLIKFIEKFLGTVKFGNDQIAPILDYGDLVQGAVTIKRVYYVEGLNHNLFSVGQFCDADLEVA
nr:integrase, catalytic region, zinc finger, CCHC-type, peptidase aspartic, catalytic [Tanacetum cinerariifolium]